MIRNLLIQSHLWNELSHVHVRLKFLFLSPSLCHSVLPRISHLASNGVIIIIASANCFFFQIVYDEGRIIEGYK